MEFYEVERRTAVIVDTIDTHMRHGHLPSDALTFSDVSKHATEPVGDFTGLSERDRGRVICRVDEVLRVRAGGVF